MLGYVNVGQQSRSSHAILHEADVEHKLEKGVWNYGHDHSLREGQDATYSVTCTVVIVKYALEK